MRICIAAKQQHLEYQHASSPNARTTSEPRQNVFAHDRLNLEKQKGAYENGRCKQQDCNAVRECVVHRRTRLSQLAHREIISLRALEKYRIIEQMRV